MCDGEGGARARHEEVRTRCHATAECQEVAVQVTARSRVIGGVGDRGIDHDCYGN